MSKTNGKPDLHLHLANSSDKKLPPANDTHTAGKKPQLSRAGLLKAQIMASVVQRDGKQKRILSPTDNAALAGEILVWAEVTRETFEAFWAQLDEASQEALASWISLTLDGDLLPDVQDVGSARRLR